MQENTSVSPGRSAERQLPQRLSAAYGLDELQRGFERESRTPQLTKNKTKDDAQLALFREPGEELLQELRDVDPNATTPLDALQQLTEWKKRFGGE